MKQIKLYSLVVTAFAAMIIIGCGSGRTNSSSAARESRSYITLIITPHPGFTMSHSGDGRYYHRSRQGFIYWKGFDNRFFLDKKYINRANYRSREYNEWKRWYEQQYSNGRRRR